MATVLEWARKLFSTPEKCAALTRVYSLRELRGDAAPQSPYDGVSLVRRGIVITASEFALLAVEDTFIAHTLLPLLACFSTPPAAEASRFNATPDDILKLLAGVPT